MKNKVNDNIVWEAAKTDTFKTLPAAKPLEVIALCEQPDASEMCTADCPRYNICYKRSAYNKRRYTGKHNYNKTDKRRLQ